MVVVECTISAIVAEIDAAHITCIGKCAIPVTGPERRVAVASVIGDDVYIAIVVEITGHDPVWIIARIPHI